MNAPQIHLMLNHLPVVGIVFVAITLGVGVLRRSDILIKFGFAGLLVFSLVAVPVFLTGEPTEHAIEKMGGISTSHIEDHESAAMTAMIGLSVLGLGGLLALIVFRRRPVSRSAAVFALVATFALSGVLAWTAHLGGQIRHAEIRPTAAVTAADGGSEAEHRSDD